jgi:hypothetical protein
MNGFSIETLNFDSGGSFRQGQKLTNVAIVHQWGLGCCGFFWQ